MNGQQFSTAALAEARYGFAFLEKKYDAGCGDLYMALLEMIKMIYRKNRWRHAVQNQLSLRGKTYIWERQREREWERRKTPKM